MNLMRKIIAYVKSFLTPLKCGKLFRENIRNPYDRLRLKNKDFSIICSNCIGGVMSHDLGQKFLSPTVNLYIPPNYFIKFVENLPFYLNQDLRFEDTDEFTYPVAMLCDIPIYFIHFKTEEQAREKWNERKTRINFDNVFIMMTDRYSCSMDTFKRFDALEFKNKICFTANEYPEFKSTYFLPEYKDEGMTGIITDMVNIWGKRAYQQGGFDYVKFLNRK